MPRVRLINPRSRHRRAGRKSHRRRVGARRLNKSLRSQVSAMISRRIAGGGNTMKKRRNRRRINRSYRHRTRRHRPMLMRRSNRRSNPFFRRHRARRRHNPVLGLSFKRIGVMTAGGLANAWATAKLPAMFMGGSNQGILGLAAAGGVALAGSWLAARWDADAGSGAVVGGAMVFVDRLLNEFFGVDLLSGSLSYYGSDHFPWPAGASQGPFSAFPGGRYLSAAPIPTTATAVRAGQSAQAAAAVAAAAPPAAAAAPGTQSRWTDHW